MNKNLKLICLFLACISAASCSRNAPKDVENKIVEAEYIAGAGSDYGAIEFVSLIELIANPEKYDGKLISVKGYVHLEFESNAIYLHREDYEHGLSRNSLWLSVNDEVFEQKEKYSDKYALVEGTFNARSKGHFGMHSGSVESIRRLAVLRMLPKTGG